MEGLAFPRTATGRASILPPLPWHYSGDLLTVEYRTDPGAVRRLLPAELDLPNDDEDPGAIAFIFADWQACSDDGRELDDPIRLQYKEAFVVCRVRWRGALWSRCLFIWVDKDFAMVRGHLQGYPKKLGSIHVSRPVTVGRGGPRLEPGGRFAGTVAAYDRRLASARVTLTGPSATNGFVNALAMLHHRYVPRIEGDGRDSLDELVTMRGRDVELSEPWAGTAELEVHDSPVEELTSIAPIEVLGGYWRSVGTTFAGGETLERDQVAALTLERDAR
jgi:acetoacetate decarboxylase